MLTTEPLSADALSWLPALLQSSDSLYPTGAYAHSNGLESLVSLGVVRDALTLTVFLRERLLPMLAHYELPYLGYAAQAGGDVTALTALDAAFGAGKLAREARAASAQIGTQRLRLLTHTHPAAQPFLAAVTCGEAAGHAVVVCGLQAWCQATPVEASMTAYTYGSLAGFCSAALKLIRIGQEGCQRVLSECLKLAPAIVARALRVEREDAGWCDPAWEIAAARHERAFARLFIS